MNTLKPINLTINDITQTRMSGHHCHWPVDPDTTARLNRVIESGHKVNPKKSIYRPYVVFLAIVLGAVFVALLAFARVVQ